METNGDEQFHEVRNQVVGFTSDQGAEKDIGEGTVLVIPRYRRFFFLCGDGLLHVPSLFVATGTPTYFV